MNMEKAAAARVVPALSIIYYGSWAGVFCEAPDPAVFGPIRLLKLWLDDKLVCNYLGDNEKVVAGGAMKKFRFYSGSETQLPNSTIEAHKGVGNVPAWLGDCYGVFNDLKLARYGNQKPTVRALIGPGEAASPGIYPVIGTDMIMDPEGWLSDCAALMCGLVLTQDELFIYRGVGDWDNETYTWQKISTIYRKVITERIYYGSDFVAECGYTAIPFGYHQAFDVDEQQRIFAILCNGYGDICMLDGDTFTIQKRSGTKPVSLSGRWLSRVLVSRNPSFPYLWTHTQAGFIITMLFY
jgi:hypothetical protein